MVEFFVFMMGQTRSWADFGWRQKYCDVRRIPGNTKMKEKVVAVRQPLKSP